MNRKKIFVICGKSTIGHYLPIRKYKRRNLKKTCVGYDELVYRNKWKWQKDEVHFFMTINDVEYCTHPFWNHGYMDAYVNDILEKPYIQNQIKYIGLDRLTQIVKYSCISKPEDIEEMTYQDIEKSFVFHAALNIKEEIRESKKEIED